MKLKFLSCFGILAGSVGLVVNLSAAAAMPKPQLDPATAAALAAHARSVLHQIMDPEQTWVRIHAAEALMAAGESEAVRADFRRRMPEFESSKIRVGVWRVLATTSPTPADRADCIAHLEQIYLDPSAPDHPQSLETLCKLGHQVKGPTLELVRREAAGPPSAQMALALWSAQLAGERNALPGLTALLASPDPALRISAAYALRWLHLSDPAMRKALARAAATEPADSSAYAFILGAALQTGAVEREKLADMVVALDRVFNTGTAAARFEASWTLQRLYEPRDLPRIVPFLDLSEQENDARVGTATIILTVLARQ